MVVYNEYGTVSAGDQRIGQSINIGRSRPHVVHASQGHKVGLYTPTILGGNSYLSWFYDRGAIKDPADSGTSKGLSQAINRGPIRKFLPNYANVYVTIQSHALSAGVQTHYVTANGVRNRLRAEYLYQDRSHKTSYDAKKVCNLGWHSLHKDHEGRKTSCETGESLKKWAIKGEHSLHKDYERVEMAIFHLLSKTVGKSSSSSARLVICFV